MMHQPLVTTQTPSTSTDQAVVRCVDVGRTYGAGELAVVAVHNVTCSVHPDDRIAVVGPSGSGKSTLLHLLSGLAEPSAGRIEWPALGGHPRDDPQRVGLVFQAPSLIPSLSALENIELPMLLAGVDAGEARQRGIDALALLGLTALSDDLPQELSGGQAQRIVIARVLAARPRLVLADEPTSRLDRDAAGRVAEVLIQVSDEIGAALVVSTHDPAVGEHLSTVWTVRDGRLTTSDGRSGQASSAAHSDVAGQGGVRS